MGGEQGADGGTHGAAHITGDPESNHLFPVETPWSPAPLCTTSGWEEWLRLQE